MINPALHYVLHPNAGGVPEETPVILISDKDTAVFAVPSEEGDGGSGDASPDAEDGARFPSLGELLASAAAARVERGAPLHEIALWVGRPVVAVSLSSEELDAVIAETGMVRETYRGLYLRVSDIELGLLARAIQIVAWYRTSRYCSACGTATEVPERESVARCPSCGFDQYPRMAPAMIVAVVRDGKILLAHARRFRHAFHSVLAGFVEPGETVEECVHREVYEETRILVKNVRYFGSQSWPFPHSFMLGFTAEWAGGEIEIGDDELEHAEWYAPHELPPVPTEISISGRLIRNFRQTYG